ncbi:hypothetical protein GCM10020360_08020 [Nonlabens tegetincola]
MGAHDEAAQEPEPGSERDPELAPTSVRDRIIAAARPMGGLPAEAFMAMREEEIF